MKAVEELVETLAGYDVRLWEERGSLRFSAPKEVLTAELREEMASRKEELLAFLRAASEATRPGMPPIRRRRHGEPVPLSFAQQRLWFLDQLHPGNPAYTLTHAVLLRGHLEIGALRRAFTTIAQRHEILRTVFTTIDGVASQVVREQTSVEVVYEDLSTIATEDEGRRDWVRRLLAREVRRPFDLSRGPLLRARLLRLAVEEHVLAVFMHHIVGDGWSEAIFVKELTALYTGFSTPNRNGPDPSLPDLLIQFGDYAVWQRQYAGHDAFVDQREYWRRTLAGAPTVLELVTDRPRPSTQTFAGGRVNLAIDGSLSAPLIKLAAGEATTPFVVMLTAWAVVLGHHTRQKELIIGTPVANRDRRELEPLIGFFVNTLAVRIDLTGKPSVVELLRRVRHATIEGLEHQGVPFEQVVEDLGLTRDLSHSPLFQTMLVMVPPTSVIPPPGQSWSRQEIDFPFAKLDLTLFIRSWAESGYTAELEYNSDLFDRSSAERLTTHFVHVLGAMTAEAEQPAMSIPLMDDAERRQLLLDWNHTSTAPPSPRCAHHLIENQAQQSPVAVAVRSIEGQLTYAQLDQAATEAAGALVGAGVGPGVTVGVCLRRTPNLLVCLLAIWKAGGAFLPLDPSFPDERLAFMVEDAAAPMVIVDDDAEERGFPHPVTVGSLVEAGTGSVPAVSVSPEHLAYVIYTSGSSGRPKGVMIPHRGLVNYLEWCCEAYPVQIGLGAPVYTSIGFDATLTSLLLPLVAGRAVFLLPEGNELEALAADLRSPAGYSFVKVTPAHLDVLAALVGDDLNGDSTGCFIIGGEALLGRHLTAWRERLPTARFFNEYGPTETVVGCCVFELSPLQTIPSWRVPIGRPINNTSLFVLDEQQMPVPVGAPGELCVAGVGVGLGYVNRQQLSEKSFSSGHFFEAKGVRLYRTGDLARHRSDGTLEYLGRIDEQINLNGFRIEPGEVEVALTEHTDVRECVVVADEGTMTGRARLVAYYTFRSEAAPSERELLRQLRRRLPEFMMPARLVALDEIPLTGNGKIDRAALPAPAESETASDYLPPSTRDEKTLVEIWQDVLGVERVGTRDNFFDLGGDSILSIQAVARAARRGLVLSPRLLFQHQTIAELARQAKRPAAAGNSGHVSGQVSLTPIQSWFFERQLHAPHHYNQAVLLETTPVVDPARLRAAFAIVIAHHSAFRHRFTLAGDRWRQLLTEDHQEVPFTEVDLSHLDLEERSQAITAEADRLHSSLDLGCGPLVRGVYMAGGKETGRLAVVAHHLVVDGVSWRILLDDLKHCYDLLREGAEPELPPATTPFAVWAEELVAFAGSQRCGRDLDFWREVVRLSGASLPTDHVADGAANTVDSAEVVTVELSPDETTRLLEGPPRSYRVGVNEVLLTALARTLASWCVGDHLLIDLENHGREPLSESIDVSRTVGWFTSLFPLRLPLDRHADTAAQVRSVARCVRSIPSNGFSYGILRYLHPRGQLLVPDNGTSPQLSWNFLGRWDTGAEVTPFVGPAAESAGHVASPIQKRSHLIDVEALVIGDRLKVDWGFSIAFHRRSTIAGLAERFRGALLSLTTAPRPSEAPLHAALEGLDEDQQEQLASVIKRLDEDDCEGRV